MNMIKVTAALFAGGMTVACGFANEPALKRSDVVFMYASSEEAYKAYGATFVAWGGADTEERVRWHHDLGLRCTASMWCLTAGAKLIHERPEIRAACAVDIEGNPVEVPWLFDHTHEGTKSYFGCTNHPEFRKLCRERVETCMKGGADGLHVDDHLGVAQAAWNFGGGLCDHCITAFRGYLERKVSPEELRAADVEDVATFDYRDIIRKHATTREEYRKVQQQIPLMDRFLEFHAETAADHVKLLGEIAKEAAGRPVLLSANAGLPQKMHTYVVKNLTHVVCEVRHNATEGTQAINHALEAYGKADALGRPMASTASGWDWAFVKANDRETLVRFWIALAYAHGQRFMVPHPKRQWCFTDKLGTHWYEAPIQAYAPLYRFVRANADRLDGFDAASADGIRTADRTRVAARRNAATGALVLHVLNLNYVADEDRMLPARDVSIRMPKSLVPSAAHLANVLSYDTDALQVPIQRTAGECEIVVPELRLWSLVAVD